MLNVRTSAHFEYRRTFRSPSETPWVLHCYTVAIKVLYSTVGIWHRLMKREPVRLGDQSLQKCFMAVLFKIRSANVFLVFIFTANWVL